MGAWQKAAQTVCRIGAPWEVIWAREVAWYIALLGKRCVLPLVAMAVGDRRQRGALIVASMGGCDRSLYWAL